MNVSADSHEIVCTKDWSISQTTRIHALHLAMLYLQSTRAVAMELWGLADDKN